MDLNPEPPIWQSSIAISHQWVIASNH